MPVLLSVLIGVLQNVIITSNLELYRGANQPHVHTEGSSMNIEQIVGMLNMRYRGPMHTKLTSTCSNTQFGELLNRSS